jgi:hypothetical protein
MLWKCASQARPEVWEPLLDGLVGSVESLLGSRVTCRLHVIVYRSNDDARAALARAVPPNMLLAPALGPRDSVIAVQSVAADPANGDCQRMSRHLSHEVAHVMVALETGSEKRLGDGDRHLRVSPWVNEGFAVCAAALATGQLEAIRRAVEREMLLTTKPFDLDGAVNDLAGPHRSAATAIATSRVWGALQVHGVRQVFSSLHHFESLAPRSGIDTFEQVARRWLTDGGGKVGSGTNHEHPESELSDD